MLVVEWMGRLQLAKQKQVASLPLNNYFVGLEQGSVMLKIKLQFFMHTITSDFDVPPQL